MKEGYIRVGILPRIPFSDPDTEAAYWDFLAELQEEDRMTYSMAKTVDPDGKATEWETVAEWPAENGGTYQMSRPKDQDQDEPATPAPTQTRSLGWTGYQLTAKELRGWIAAIPDEATLSIIGPGLTV